MRRPCALPLHSGYGRPLSQSHSTEWHIVLVIEDVGTEISIPIGDALLHHLIHAFAKGVILPVKLEHTEDAGIHKVGATGLSIRRPHSPSHYRIFFAIENLCGN